MDNMDWLVAALGLIIFVALSFWWLPRLKGMAKGRTGGAMLAMSSCSPSSSHPPRKRR